MRGGQYEPDTRADDEHASYSLSRTHDGAHTHERSNAYRQLMKVETGGKIVCRGNTFQMLVVAQAGQAECPIVYIYVLYLLLIRAVTV